MKRIIPLLAALLLATLPAQAITWFDDGEKLHRDPFCVDAAFSFDSFYTPALQLANVDEARAHGVLCESCTTLSGPAADADEPVPWYYNPDGGRYYHRNADCPSISQKYRPLTNSIVAESPDWWPENPCKVCGYAQQVVHGPSDLFAWEAPPAEKAQLLPGVWTAPAEDALHYSIAASAACDFLQTLYPKETCALSVAHYDHGGPSEGENRPTYKVVALSMLQHPLAIVYVDALTGEVYHHQLAADYAK